MSAHLMILPTGDAIRANKEVFARLPEEGLPLMLLTQYLVDLLASGETEPFNQEELMTGWAHYLHDNRLLTERLNRFMSAPAFAEAVYALYECMQKVQELMLTAPREQGGFLSGLVHQGWTGQDMIVVREITTMGRH